MTIKLRKFGRRRGQRQAFIKGLLHNLIMQERIQTTEARAKEMKSLFDRLVNTAKKHDLTALRRLQRILPKRSAQKLYYTLAPAFKSRKSGYTRFLRGLHRKRDSAKTAVIELIKDMQ